MANYKGPAKGGSGGKRGHSGMEHWVTTEEIKESSKVTRRKDDLLYSSEGIDEATRKYLTTYWFPLTEGIGIGVTAYSEEEAFKMATKCSKLYFENQKVKNPVVGIKAAELDQEHVVPNMGPINLRGIWYPNVNL